MDTTTGDGIQLLAGSSDEVVAGAVDLLKEIETNTNSFVRLVENTIAKIKAAQLTTSKGLSFLELKNLTMLSYLINLTYVMQRKCNGQSIAGSKAIERIVEARTTLEKMKPVNKKIQYRIDKMVRAANLGDLNPNDPLNMRPNPADMLGDLQEEEHEDGSDDSELEADVDQERPARPSKKSERVEKSDKSKKDGIYRPPKVMAMHYDDDEDADGKKQKTLEKAKRRAFSTSVIQELRNEFDDAPEEIAESSVGRRKINKQAKDRERYEEEYMVRLNVTKKQKQREGKQNFLTMSGLAHDITRFENLSVLDRDELGEPSTSAAGGKKRKSTSNGKRKSSFGGKRKKNVKKFKRRM